MGRLLITSFGFNDGGGGTTVPRLAATELARRGWEVTVFYAAVEPTPSRCPYELSERVQDGVRLVGVHNRGHGLFDLRHPDRELDDPAISAAFAATLDRVRPTVVHFHNLHNLGASLMDHTFARGIPSYFSTHNYWLICPRAYLLTGDGTICPGPGDGSRCATCTGSHDLAGHRDRLAGIRARAQRGLTAILAVSDSVRRTLMAAGYPAELIDVVRQAMPHETAIWDEVGRGRRPGRRSDRLTVAFLGSAYPHKGPQLLVQAAQRTRSEIRVEILGEVPDRFAASLTALDRRGVTTVRGAFAPAEIGGLLAGVDAAVLPSLWWDCAPLAAAECRAAGIPLVVPRLGGLAETARDEIDGLLFDALDADDLARQLDRLADEPGLLERLQGAIEPPKAFGAYIDELEAYYAGERPGRPAAPAAPAPTVRWQGDHGLSTSLSIINDRVSDRLAGPVQRIDRNAAAIDRPLPQLADVEVRHQWPPDFSPPPAGRLAVIQPWEFGAVPTEWVAQIDEHVDELWVPSEFVRRMYIDGGVDAERVVAIPNGVDLEDFAPAPERANPAHVRFLFVGGLIARKAPDVLLRAWRRAFAGRDDVTLLVKDFGADGVYRDGQRGPIREHAASGALPRIELLETELTTPQLADLYRSCDVLVHPYRGEGFAMPVLEAMACGLPVIVTGGGPTDEFCPPDAGWRIRSTRVELPDARIGPFRTAGTPWMLEPDEADLAALMQAAAGAPDERRRRGERGRAAADRLSWDTVAERYRERIAALAQCRPRLAGPPAAEPAELDEDVELRVLATPAWRGADRLPELLREWSDATTPETSACLYLLADPAVDGAPAELEARVLAAAADGGAELEDCADINVLMEPIAAGRAERLHAAMDAYVILHPACAGHERLARNPVYAGDGTLTGLVAGRARAYITSR